MRGRGGREVNEGALDLLVASDCDVDESTKWSDGSLLSVPCGSILDVGGSAKVEVRRGGRGKEVDVASANVAEDPLSCLRGGSFGTFGAVVGCAVELGPGVGADLPGGRGGGTREIRSDGSPVIGLTLVKLEKGVEADVVLALLFFLTGRSGGGKPAEEGSPACEEANAADGTAFAGIVVPSVLRIDALSSIATRIAELTSDGKEGRFTGACGLLWESVYRALASAEVGGADTMLVLAALGPPKPGKATLVPGPVSLDDADDTRKRSLGLTTTDSSDLVGFDGACRGS